MMRYKINYNKSSVTWAVILWPPLQLGDADIRVLHRLDGPAELWCGGRGFVCVSWYKMGKRHRIGAPAVQFYDGSFEFWEEGEQHREGAPTCCYIYGDTIKEFWIERGVQIKVESRKL